MIQLENIHNVYFIGIGGIGMSALARYFHARNAEVSGYDKTPTPLTRMLEQSGIAITYNEAAPVNTAAQLIIYTPAVQPQNTQLAYYRTHGYPVLKRSEVLEVISNGSFNICVAGTHGKTTISTMIAHLLRHSGYGCNAFLGGISTNYNTNFWSSERNVCVIEADEYDRSFLRLHPDVAVVSAMDADHLDIYGDAYALEQAFIGFTGKIKTGGLLIKKFGLARGSELNGQHQLSYSLQNDAANVYAANIRMTNGAYCFDVMMNDNMLDEVVLNMGGMHNVENAIAAITVAHHLGIKNAAIKAAVAAFSGVKRRFEYIIKNEAIVFIDDYAHHPEELKALLTGARALFGGRKCTVIFQPHLFSRTMDFAEGFAESLGIADRIILLPIYPARELPVEGVTSELILGKMQHDDASVMTKEAVLQYCADTYLPQLDNQLGEMLITAGAGDIDTLVEPIKKLINENV